jgi:hypothetical protein
MMCFFFQIHANLCTSCLQFTPVWCGLIIFFPFSLVDVDYFSVSVVDCFIFKNSWILLCTKT